MSTLALLLLVASAAAAPPSIEDLVAQVAELTQQVQALKTVHLRHTQQLAEQEIELAVLRQVKTQGVGGAATPASIAASANAAMLGRRALQSSSSTTTCAATTAASPATLSLRPPGELGEVLHGATLSAKMDGALSIESTGSITLKADPSSPVTVNADHVTLNASASVNGYLAVAKELTVGEQGVL